MIPPDTPPGTPVVALETCRHDWARHLDVDAGRTYVVDFMAPCIEGVGVAIVGVDHDRPVNINGYLVRVFHSRERFALKPLPDALSIATLKALPAPARELVEAHAMRALR